MASPAASPTVTDGSLFNTWGQQQQQQPHYQHQNQAYQYPPPYFQSQHQLTPSPSPTTATMSTMQYFKHHSYPFYNSHTSNLSSPTLTPTPQSGALHTTNSSYTSASSLSSSSYPITPTGPCQPPSCALSCAPPPPTHPAVMSTNCNTSNTYYNPPSYQPLIPMPRQPLIINSYNIHRILISAVMVAVKFMSDVFFTNAHMAKVGGLPLQELNQLEMEFLKMCDYNLTVSTRLDVTLFMFTILLPFFYFILFFFIVTVFLVFAYRSIVAISSIALFFSFFFCGISLSGVSSGGDLHDSKVKWFQIPLFLFLLSFFV
jgi:hypothetical protein